MTIMQARHIVRVAHQSGRISTVVATDIMMTIERIITKPLPSGKLFRLLRSKGLV